MYSSRGEEIEGGRWIRSNSNDSEKQVREKGRGTMGEDFVVCALGILSSYGSPLQFHSLSLSFSSSLFFIFVLLFHATHINRYFSLIPVSLFFIYFLLLSGSFSHPFGCKEPDFSFNSKQRTVGAVFYLSIVWSSSDFQFFKIVNFLIKWRGSSLHFRERGEWATGEKVKGSESVSKTGFDSLLLSHTDIAAQLSRFTWKLL